MEDDDDLMNLPICINDVYDLAADIAVEFERITDLGGPDLIRNLINKIISVLEHLENTVIRFQSLSDYLTQLKHQICELKIKRSTLAENKIKYEQDLADVEESWTKEIVHLNEKIYLLQAENKQLQNQSWTEQTDVSMEKSVSDDCAIQELQNLVLSLNYQLKEKEDSLKQYAFEMTSVKQSIVQQADAKQKLHEKIFEYQNEIKQLWLEKRDLGVELKDQSARVESLKQQLEETLSSKIEEHIPPSRSIVAELDEQFIYDESLKYYKQERELFLSKINELQVELINSEREMEYIKKKYSEGPKPPRRRTGNKQAPVIRQMFDFFREVDEDANPTFRY